MIRLTPAWTKAHRALLPLLLLLAIGCASAASREPLSTAVALCGVLLFVSVAALALEPSIGVTIGIGGAAAGVLIRKSTGEWTEADFVPALIHAVSCIALGLAAGPVGQRFIDARDQQEATDATAVAVGTLGLLSAGLGELRLEEEIERGRLFGRPVSVIRLKIIPRRSLANDPSRQRLMYRAVARQVESVVRITDIPFAYDSTDIAIVLPETDGDGAIQAARRVGTSLRSCSFGIRPFGQRIRLADYVDISLATCSVATDDDAASVLAGLTLLLDDWRPPDPEEPFDDLAHLVARGDPPAIEWHPLKGDRELDRPHLRLVDNERRRATDQPVRAPRDRTTTTDELAALAPRLSALHAALERSAGLTREAMRLQAADRSIDDHAARSFGSTADHDPMESRLVLAELQEALTRATDIANELQRDAGRDAMGDQSPVPFARRGAR